MTQMLLCFACDIFLLVLRTDMLLVCFWFCKNRKEMANCWTVRRNYFKAFTCTEWNFCLFAECWDHISPLKEVGGFWLNLVVGESALSCQATLFWTVHHSISTTLPLQMERFWLLAILTEAFCFFIRLCWGGAQGIHHTVIVVPALSISVTFQPLCNRICCHQWLSHSMVFVTTLREKLYMPK